MLEDTFRFHSPGRGCESPVAVLRRNLSCTLGPFLPIRGFFRAFFILLCSPAILGHFCRAPWARGTAEGGTSFYSTPLSRNDELPLQPSSSLGFHDNERITTLPLPSQGYSASQLVSHRMQPSSAAVPSRMHVFGKKGVRGSRDGSPVTWKVHLPHTLPISRHQI